MDVAESVFEEASLNTPELNKERGIYSLVANWTGRDYKGRLSGLVLRKLRLDDIALSSGKNEGWKHSMSTVQEGLAQAQMDLVMALWSCRATADLKRREHIEALTEFELELRKKLLVSSNALVKAGNENQQQLMRNILRGSLSLLKFFDIMSAASRRSGNDFMHSISYDPSVDVHNRVDCEFRFGDRNSKGKEIVRLVQYKTAPEFSSVYVNRIKFNEPLTQDQLNFITEQDKTRMLEYAKSLTEDNPNIVVRAFVVAIPYLLPDEYGSADNILGIAPSYRQGTREVPRESTIRDFSMKAIKAGLLPNTESEVI